MDPTGRKYPPKNIKKHIPKNVNMTNLKLISSSLILLRLAILNDTVAFSSENLDDFPQMLQ